MKRNSSRKLFENMSRMDIRNKPSQSRVFEVTQAWVEVPGRDGQTVWRNGITGKISYKQPTGPDVNENLWTMHADVSGKPFWYNPYTLKKVFKNPYASKFHFPGLRHTDVLQQKFDIENQSEDAFKVRYTRTYDGQLVIHKTRETEDGRLGG